jgi:hypothetical protein
VTTKKYDKADGVYGANGEARVRDYIRNCGYKAIKHPNGKFGEDVEYESEEERFYVDVERRCLGWGGDSWFRYRTIHVLARRPVKQGVLFFTLSADMTKAYVSFPEDLVSVEPKPMDNIHAKAEMVRDHEIMRCLPLDLTNPIEGSIARMNAERVCGIAKNCTNWRDAMRALRGVEPYGFGAPYGICDDEWRELILDVERRFGLGEYVSRKRVTEYQTTLF